MREILRRGLAIAADEGTEALTIQRLAGELDYTPGALYRYFPSKDVLVAEMQRSVIVFLSQAVTEVVQRTRRWADAQARDSAGRALLPVAAACSAFVDFAERFPGEFGFLSRYLSDPQYRLPEDEARYVHSATEAALAALVDPLEQAVEAEVLAPGDGFARALTAWSSLQGVLQTRKLARSDPRVDASGALARQLVRTLLIGWGGSPDSVDRALEKIESDELAHVSGSPDELFLNAPRRERKTRAAQS